MSTAAETIVNAFLPVAERAVTAGTLARRRRDRHRRRRARARRVDQPPDSEPEPDAVTSAEGLTVAELDALPEWSVVDATGGERWFVKCPDGWSAVGENYFIRLPEELIADEGPIRLECRASGPDQLVIKRPIGWGPDRARDVAKQWSDFPLSGILHAVADALEAER